MLRIIAGEFRGRRIASPRGLRVRPTADRVKESLFQIIGPFLTGLDVLDLYAGTGNLGLEALSRGALSCLFVDSSASCCSVIRRNVAGLGLAERSAVMRSDCVRALRMLAGRGRRFGLVLADPPYSTPGRRSEFKKLLCSLEKYDIFAPSSLLVVEHFKSDELQGGFSRLDLFRQKRYGDTAVSFFRIME